MYTECTKPVVFFDRIWGDVGSMSCWGLQHVCFATRSNPQKRQAKQNNKVVFFVFLVFFCVFFYIFFFLFFFFFFLFFFFFFFCFFFFFLNYRSTEVRSTHQLVLGSISDIFMQILSPGVTMSSKTNELYSINERSMPGHHSLKQPKRGRTIFSHMF